MFKTRFISILALLCLTVTSAWAQEVTLLTTIESEENESFTSGSKTFDNIATVTFSGEVINECDEDGWYSYPERTLTVTAAEGYTITRVKFYTKSGSAFDEDAPFKAILVDDDFEGNIAKVNGTSIGARGVIRIDVYGYAGTPEPATVAVTGVTLSPTSATLTLGETETVTLIPTVLPNDATDKSVTWTSSNEAVATVADGVVTAVAAGEATITVTTTDGAKTATCAVTVAAPAASTYTVTLKEGTDDATSWTIAPAEATTTGVAAGTEVKATYGGTKKVKSVKAVKKAKPAATVTTAPTAKTGVKAGEDVAIVNEGAAEGGTMMYMVNATQPASTDGFSATVPTAEGLTAGTYYVWYYVKADDSHTDSEISATAVTVTVQAAGPSYPVALSAVTDDYKGSVVTTDGNVYATVTAATTAGKTAAAMICYVDGTGHGLALALADDYGYQTWTDITSHSPAVTGGTWVLASETQWTQMINAMGSDGLRDGFSSVGGTNLQDNYYWSSTPGESGHRRYDFSDKGWYNSGSTGKGYGRACLVF